MSPRAWVAAALLLPAGARPAELVFYPNFETVSIYVLRGGTSAESAPLEFREAGAGPWRPAHALVRNAAGDLAGSLFYLKPATKYEARVAFGGATLAGEVTTRSDAFPCGEKTVTVSAGESLQKAVDAAGPGTVILVKPGIYRESISVTRSGAAGAYLLIRSEKPGEAILDGSDPAAAKPGSDVLWKDEGRGVFSTAMDREPRCVWHDGVRVYLYRTRADFDANGLTAGGRRHPLRAADPRFDRTCFVDVPGKRLYVRLPGGENPGRKGIRLPLFNFGVHLKEVRHVLLDGFTIRHYGLGLGGENNSLGVAVDSSSECVVRNCTIYGVVYGIRLLPWWRPGRDGLCANTTIEHNTIYDHGPAGVPWELYKENSPDWEAAAIANNVGRGTVIRYNRLFGFFGGVKPGILGDSDDRHLTYPWITPDMDIHDNHFSEIKDDGVEPDGPCTNIRIWNNVFENVHHGVSCCPNGCGPAWVVRNLFHHRPGGLVTPGSLLKLANGNLAGHAYVYHNTLANAAAGAAGLGDASPWGGYILRNNIVSGSAYALNFGERHDRSDFDYDLLHSRDGGRFVRWNNVRYPGLEEFRSRTGQEKHGLSAEPRFVSEAALDFRLAEGSPALDRGVLLPNISEGWGGVRGSGPDLGAFERGDTVPLPRRVPK